MGWASYPFCSVAQTPRPSDSVRIGQVYLGKYRIESILGHGGMGVVAECTHLQLNQRLAIKMLRQDVLLDQDAVERFKREAQAAAKLKSEYVAKVSDVGELENGTPYMVMEYLEGHDLGALIAERGNLAVQWTCDLMLQTAEALAEAHSVGIVHRDIKPTNLFVTWRPDGTALIKVLDFGISKSTFGVDMHLTQTQSLLGTPAYMSPEQMRSARLVDGRTDIWSLGSVMYELLEGRKPFEAESFSEMCVKVAVDPPAPMVNAPPELQQVVMRCLAKSPEQRYPSMAEFARDLVPFVPDSHQASLLVERMQRMLRRSEAAMWDGASTGAGARSVPNHVRDPGGSQPVRTPWRAGSESGVSMRTPVPGGSMRTPAPGVPVRLTSLEPSAPARAPSEIGFSPPTRKSRVGFVLLAAAVIGVAGVAIGLTLSGDDTPSTATDRTTAPSRPTAGTTTTVAPTKAVPIAEPTTPQDGAKTGATPVDTTKTPETAATPETVKTVDTAAIAKTAPAKTGTGAKTGAGAKTGTGAKAGTGAKTGTPKGTGQVGKAGKDGKDGGVPPTQTPKATPTCDVFLYPHGCPKT